ncbi:MAG TPA: hypothetical protein VFR97_08760 [Capillimicrobium sp.]|nr:hypothetical protein [Capillimicrobium sp.]
MRGARKRPAGAGRRPLVEIASFERVTAAGGAPVLSLVLRVHPAARLQPDALRLIAGDERVEPLSAAERTPDLLALVFPAAAGATGEAPLALEVSPSFSVPLPAPVDAAPGAGAAEHAEPADAVDPVGELRAALEAARQERDAVHRHAAALEARLREAEPAVAEVARLRDDLAAAAAEREQLSAELEELRDEVEAAIDRSDDLRHALEDAERRERAATERAAAAAEALDDTRARLEELEPAVDEVARLRARVEALSGELAAAQRDGDLAAVRAQLREATFRAEDAAARLVEEQAMRDRALALADERATALAAAMARIDELLAQGRDAEARRGEPDGGAPPGRLADANADDDDRRRLARELEAARSEALAAQGRLGEERAAREAAERRLADFSARMDELARRLDELAVARRRAESDRAALERRLQAQAR